MQMRSKILLIGHQVNAFHEALENLLHTIPGLGDVLDTAVDKLLEKADVPRSISIYAASYCIQSYEASGAATNKCFQHKSNFFDVAAGLRVYIAILYALGVSSSVASLVCLWQMIWRDTPRYRNWAFVFTLIATLAVGLASSITSILGCAVYMVFSGNLPESLLSASIGQNFLVLTWLAVACLTLVLCTIVPQAGSRMS
jgi:hypothetical protein